LGDGRILKQRPMGGTAARADADLLLRADHLGALATVALATVDLVDVVGRHPIPAWLRVRGRHPVLARPGVRRHRAGAVIPGVPGVPGVPRFTAAAADADAV